ncbi:MAG: hypothetical protein ABIV63_02080 [Caldimonas sp.]
MNTRDPMNKDPITGAPGAHPVGTGVGATGGAVAGAAIGSIAGPIGTAVGAVAGAVAGGLAGKGAAEGVNPTAGGVDDSAGLQGTRSRSMFDPMVEADYWRGSYDSAPYYRDGHTFDDYGPAYEMGYTGVNRYSGDFDNSETHMSNEWEKVKGKSRLAWDDAKHAARAGWDRVERAMPGDADGDGR